MSTQSQKLRELRAWLGLPPKDDAEDDALNYENYENDKLNTETARDKYHGGNAAINAGLFEDFEIFKADGDNGDNGDNSKNDSDKDGGSGRNRRNLRNRRGTVRVEDLFESYSSTAIDRTFTIGSCYQVVSNKTIIKRLRAGEKYAVQTVNESSDDPEFGYTFRYLGKQGIHHVFREISCGWGRTYTDAQLVGKEVIEVSEAEVRRLRKSLMQAEVKF